MLCYTRGCVMRARHPAHGEEGGEWKPTPCSTSARRTTCKRHAGTKLFHRCTRYGGRRTARARRVFRCAPCSSPAAIAAHSPPSPPSIAKRVRLGTPTAGASRPPRPVGSGYSPRLEWRRALSPDFIAPRRTPAAARAAARTDRGATRAATRRPRTRPMTNCSPTAPARRTRSANWCWQSSDTTTRSVSRAATLSARRSN